jgi:hypothetical protein
VEPTGEGPFPAVLMLHGFASQKDEVGNMYERLAAALGERGIASLRIDFRGWGESGGEMADSTVTGMVEDAAAAYEYLREQDFAYNKRIGLIGFSLGGAVSLLSAGQNPDWYDTMVIWSWGGSLQEEMLSDFDEEQLSTAEREGEVTVDLGWRKVTLGEEFFDSLEALDVEAQFLNYPNSLFAVAGSDDFAAKYLPWYMEKAKGDLKASYLVEGAGHIYGVLGEDQSMAEKVIRRTAEWFELALE